MCLLLHLHAYISTRLFTAPCVFMSYTIFVHPLMCICRVWNIFEMLKFIHININNTYIHTYVCVCECVLQRHRATDTKNSLNFSPNSAANNFTHFLYYFSFVCLRSSPRLQQSSIVPSVSVDCRDCRGCWLTSHVSRWLSDWLAYSLYDCSCSCCLAPCCLLLLPEVTFSVSHMTFLAFQLFVQLFLIYFSLFVPRFYFYYIFRWFVYFSIFIFIFFCQFGSPRRLWLRG